MKSSFQVLRKYWKPYLATTILVLGSTLAFILLRHRGSNPMEKSLVIKGKVFELIEVTSRKTIARIKVFESSVKQYDVRDKEESWCCGGKGQLGRNPNVPI